MALNRGRISGELTSMRRGGLIGFLTRKRHLGQPSEMRSSMTSVPPSCRMYSSSKFMAARHSPARSSSSPNP